MDFFGEFTHCLINLFRNIQSSILQMFHERTKHKHVRSYFVRDVFMKGDACIVKINTHDNLADMRTKTMLLVKFKHVIVPLDYMQIDDHPYLLNVPWWRFSRLTSLHPKKRPMHLSLFSLSLSLSLSLLLREIPFSLLVRWALETALCIWVYLSTLL